MPELQESSSRTARPYLPRLIDPALKDALNLIGAVLIEGPRGCGKTMSGQHAAVSAAYLDDPDTALLADVSLDRVLRGTRPRLIDEWQLYPAVWNRVRRAVDASGQPGQFILTGSAVPDDDTTRHTGAARFLRLRQYTMTWLERGLAPHASLTLESLFDGSAPEDGPDGISYEALCSALVRSGMPAFRDADAPASSRLSTAYLEEIVRTDLGRLSDIRHDPMTILHLLRSVARAVSAEMSFTTIAADLTTVAPDITARTVASYVSLLERLFVLDRLDAWTPALRSRARLRTSPKWHLADPSLAVAALRTGVNGLLDDPQTVGLLFESQVVHDLRVMAAVMGGRVYHYRDSNGHEIDTVIELPDGRWGAVEVKIAQARIRDGAASLERACAQIQRQPTFRLVVTSNGPTLTLPDGTVTCPLGALRVAAQPLLP